MAAKSSINIDKIKSRIDDLFIFVSQVQFVDKHPLRVVQASKSLIGIHPEYPPEILLKWLEGYLSNFIPDFTIQPIDYGKESKEVITFSELKNLILDKKAIESNTYLSYLLQVASPTHIAEYLVELAACKSPGSLLYCWSALRSIQFLGEKEGSLILYHCISKLLEEDECKISSEKFFMEKFELFCHQFQIRNSEMVRKNKIIPQLNKLVQSIDSEIKDITFPEFSKTLIKMVAAEGTHGILSYLSSKTLNNITPNLILLLDAMRSMLAFSNMPQETVLNQFLSNFREVIDVE